MNSWNRLTISRRSQQCYSQKEPNSERSSGVGAKEQPPRGPRLISANLGLKRWGPTGLQPARLRRPEWPLPVASEGADKCGFAFFQTSRLAKKPPKPVWAVENPGLTIGWRLSDRDGYSLKLLVYQLRMRLQHFDWHLTNYPSPLKLYTATGWRLRLVPAEEASQCVFTK